MVGEERKKEDWARTRCLLGELQYYHKETYTEEELREKRGAEEVEEGELEIGWRWFVEEEWWHV